MPFSVMGRRVSFLTCLAGMFYAWLFMHLSGSIVSAAGPLVLSVPEAKGLATAVAFSPDGKLLASAHGRTVLSFWHVEPESEAERVVASYKNMGSYPEHPIVFSPKGDLLATGWLDSVRQLNAGVDVVEIETGKVRHSFRMDYNTHGAIGYFIFAPDGKHMEVAIDGMLKRWTPSTNEVRTLSAKRREEDRVQFMRYLDDGKRFVTVTKDGRIKFWDVKTGKPTGESKVSTEGFWESDGLRAEGYGGLHSCLVAADGSLAASVFRPGRTFRGAPGGFQLGIWEARECKTFRAIKLPPNDSAGRIALSEDGKWIATAHGGVLEVWDTKTTKSAGRIPYKRETEPGEGLTFSRDARFLAAGSFSSDVLLWDVSEFTKTDAKKEQGDEPSDQGDTPKKGRQ
jgi:WD40 repeat protein